MKTFTTPEHIRPVVEEFFTAYEPEKTNPATLAALDCIAVVRRKGARDCVAIRTADKGGFYYTGKAAKALLKELDSWTAAAETETGELDAWRYREEARIMEAVREAIIERLEAAA